MASLTQNWVRVVSFCPNWGRSLTRKRPQAKQEKKPHDVKF